MRSKILFVFLVISNFCFGQSVPNTTTFSLQDVVNVVNPTTDDLVDCFEDSNAAYFDANYGSKTMNPKTLYGFRNYTIPPTNLSVGDSYGCGIVGYIYQEGDPGYSPSQQHGIIVYPTYLNTDIAWYNGSYVTTGASSKLIGDADTNTNLIISVQGAGTYAASICANLSYGGCDDWYLPTENELIALHANKDAIGGFVLDNHWSSSESSGTYARQVLFDTNFSIGSAGKQFLNRVRPIRYF